MTYYRLYFLNAEGHIIGAQECDLPTDVAALDMARALDHREGVEVWQGKRKIGLVGPAAAASPC